MIEPSYLSLGNLDVAKLSYELPPSNELRAYAAEVIPSFPDRNRVVDNVPPIRYLHLSDIHFRVGESAKFDRNKVLRGLLTTLNKERESSPLDLIFITGDLAYSAKPAEYESSVTFLKELTRRGVY
jgi:predicted MPP superfamily phosphohydrolase